MGQTDSGGLLDEVRESSLADRAHAAWVMLGCAGVHVTDVDDVPPALARHAADVLWMLDVPASEVLKHHPRRRLRRRRVVRKR